MSNTKRGSAAWSAFKHGTPAGWLFGGNPIKAAKNVTQRAVALGQNQPSAGWGDIAKYAFKPQTAYANKWSTGAPNAVLGTAPALDTGQVAGATTPTNYANQTYDSGGGTTGGGEAPFEAYYNGVLYTNPLMYENAVRSDLSANYTQQKAALDRQYDEGLITFEQRQEALGKALKDARTGISSYFGAVSPEAYQSTQGGLEQEAQGTYETNTGNLGREEQNWKADVLDKIDALQTDYQNSLDALLNQTASYTSNPMGTFSASAPSQQNPTEMMNEFAKYDLTKQLYGNALPAIRKPVSKKAAVKKAGIAPLTSYMYPEETYMNK